MGRDGKANRAGNRPLVAITMGDPAGVGPEVIVKALEEQEPYTLSRPLVVGDAGRLRKAAAICKVNVEVSPVRSPSDGRYERGRIDCIDLGLVPEDLLFGELTAV